MATPFDIAPVADNAPADPVDTYVAPTPASSSSLVGAARGLVGLDSGLKDYLDVMEKKDAETDSIRGRAAFEANNRQGYDAAVTSGAIPANVSPHFVQAYKAAQGAAQGNDLQQQFSAAYDNWDGKSSTDPTAYSKFVAGFVSQHVSGTTDPDVLRGLLPAIGQLNQDGLQKYVADQHKFAVSDNQNAATSLTSQSIDSANGTGLGSPTGTDYQSLQTKIGSIYSHAVSAGMDATSRAALEEAVTKSIGEKALELRDPQLLTLMDTNIPGQSYTWAQTSEGQNLKYLYTHRMEELARSSVEHAAAAQTKADEAAKKVLTAGVISQLSQDPTKPVDEATLQQLSKYDPEARVHVISWAKDLTQAGSTSDPQQLLAVNEDIINSGDPDAALQHGLDNGVFRNAEDLRQARTLADSVKKDSTAGAGSVLKDPAAESVLGTIKDLTTSKDDFTHPFAPGGLSDLGRDRQYTFRSQMLQWASQNPQANVMDRLKAIKTIGDSVIQAIPQGTDAVTSGANTAVPTPPALHGGPQNAAPPPFHGGPNNALPAAQPVVPAPVAPPAPAPVKKSELAPDPSGFQQASFTDTGSAIDQRHPEFQGLAAQIGNTIDQANASPHISMTVQQIRQAIDDASSGKPSTGDFNLAAIKGDPQAAHILDFVSQHESGGNYNAYFGHSHSDTPLDGRTLDEVMTLQKARTDAGAPSSAIGRYQFIRTTLAGLKKQMGLTGEERFTPELQDKLAIQLLKARGLDDFKSGKMSPDDFANSLAKEWASLPNIQTGRSQYAGDGLNKSLVTPGSVIQALQASKTATDQA